MPPGDRSSRPPSTERLSLLTPRRFVDVMTTIRGFRGSKSCHGINKANGSGWCDWVDSEQAGLVVTGGPA